MVFFNLLILALLLTSLYRKMPLYSHFIIITVYLISKDFSSTFWIFYSVLLLVLLVAQIRTLILTKQIVCLIKKLGLLPKISETEKIVLTSGTVWIDGELFSGKPNFDWIFSQKYPSLNSEEKSFLENEVEELCNLCSDYQIQKNNDLPEEVWKFMREKKFFGMIIPKKFGGLEFSAYAHSCVIQKLSSRSVPLAITAMVPNSLGPAELLLHYGTKSQQDHYLPRLADGRDLPCFALTEPTAGSDATSIISNGTLFKDENNQIKIRLNWNKRYITLGAYATVIGVAFQLRDPDKILFDNEDVGITCALIPNNTQGVRQGRRHDPLATPFINSPINGENVVVGLDAVIGEKNGLGKGWKMLMECLAAGRGISLPSTSSGGAKLVLRAVGGYSSIRQQFNTSISKFEGIEEVLAKIISRTYTLDALRAMTAGSVDLGAKPAVVSAIAKYHATEMFRQIINDGMDIMGGRGIIRGSRNILANAYFSTPISITVEGANIMTRSLIHFGQGIMMCHPYSYKEVSALEKQDHKAFDQVFFAHINHFLSNFVRSVLLSITRGYLFKPFQNDIITKYQRKISWASSTFAFLADLALIRFGGNLKRKEKINGRFGDALSAMYIAVCVLKKFQENGYNKSEKEIVELSLKEIFSKAQIAFEGIYQNIFSKFGKIILTPFAFWCKFNAFSCPASDDLGHRVVKESLTNSKLKDELTSGIFISKKKDDNLGRIENALSLQEESQGVINKIKSAIKEKLLPQDRIENIVNLAYSKSIISLAELNLVNDANIAILDAMQVDEYNLEDFKK